MQNKYYMLQAGKPIRLLSLAAWETWFLSTSHNERLLAYTVVDTLSVETLFEGVVSDNGGAYVTYVSGTSTAPIAVRRYEGVDAQKALAGHLAYVDEIRAHYGRLENDEQGCKQDA